MTFIAKTALVAFLGLFTLVGCRDKKEIFGKSGSGGLQVKSNTVTSLGQKAGSEDADLLAELRGTTSTHAPAGVRPDPDTFIRDLLKLYRNDGTIIAREMGRIEPFRQLLGGASQDFSIIPQDSYDATSLLALNEVLGEICTGLVAPNANRHGDWSSILPRSPAGIEENVTFLFRSFHSLSSSEIDATKLQEVVAIVNAAKGSEAAAYAHYIPACQAILLDVESLLL